jgi:signal peptidase I
VEIATTHRRRQHRSGRILVNLLCASVMLLAVGFIVPAALGFQRYVITGSSMGGSLGVGAVAFEEVVPVNDLRVGDVITYQPPADSGIDHLVTHRIVSIQGDVYRTKGDANADTDPWTFQLTSTSQSRVSFAVPYLGYVFIALQDRLLRMILIGIPASVVALISLVQLIGAVRRRPEQVTRATVAKPTVSVGR